MRTKEQKELVERVRKMLDKEALLAITGDVGRAFYLKFELESFNCNISHLMAKMNKHEKKELLEYIKYYKKGQGKRYILLKSM